MIEKIKNQVPGALFPETKSELTCPALVTALSSRLDQIKLSLEYQQDPSYASRHYQLKQLGPTNSEKFAPKNNFTKIIDSKKIHDTTDIETITVDEIYSLI